MSKKSAEQVMAEIAALQAIKPKVPKYTALSDNNHAGIDAQIKVLTEGLDLDRVHEVFEVGSHTFYEALHASDWLHGMLNPEDDFPPSVGWIAVGH